MLTLNTVTQDDARDPPQQGAAGALSLSPVSLMFQTLRAHEHLPPKLYLEEKEARQTLALQSLPHLQVPGWPPTAHAPHSQPPGPGITKLPAPSLLSAEES